MALELLVEPGEEGFDDRLAVGEPMQALGFAALAKLQGWHGCIVDTSSPVRTRWRLEREFFVTRDGRSEQVTRSLALKPGPAR